MRRIMFMVGLVLLMASFVVVSALPALAAPPRVLYVCRTPEGAQLFRSSGNEVPRNHDTGFLRRDCTDRGGELTMTLTPDPGKPDETPPCCAGQLNR